MNSWKKWFALVSLSTGFFLSLLDQSMVAVAIPSIRAEFGTSIGQTMWVASIYLLAVVTPLLVAGRLGDVFGQKKVYCLGLTILAIGAALSALSSSLSMLIAARALQGLGASLQMPQSMAVINRIFPRGQRGRALAAWGIVGSLASLVGPVLGGFITEMFGWHGVFWIAVPLALIGIVSTLFLVPDLPTHARRIDAISVGLSIVGMSALVYGIQEDWRVLPFAFVAFILFVLRKTEDPLVPRRLFADRNYSLGALSISTMGFMAASMMLPIMVWLQEDMSPEQAGLLMMPQALISMAVTPVAGIMVDKFDPKVLSQFGFGCIIAAFAVMDLVMRMEAGSWIMVPVAMLGFGQAFVWGTNSATAMRDTPPELMGAASGVYNTMRQVGSVVGVAAVSATMQAGGDSILVIIAVLACGFVAVSFFRNTLQVDLR